MNHLASSILTFLSLSTLVVAATCEPSGSRLIPQVQGGKRFDAKSWKQEKTVTLANYECYKEGAPAPLSKYGGRADKARRPATGFFHVKKINGRWWWIDPEGCLFYGTGTGTTHTGMLIDREPYASHFKRKCGTVERWINENSTLYDSLGINCVGEEGINFFIPQQKPRPYFIQAGFLTTYYGTHMKQSYNAGREKFGNAYVAAACIDSFATFARQHAKMECRPDDPYLMGYWTEKEIPFITIKTPLLTEYLAYPDKEFAFVKRVARAWLSQKNISSQGPFPETLEQEFRMHLVSTYHRVCYEALKQADPKHLCCGYRMNNGWGANQVLYRDENFWRAIAPWVDVQCVNLYNTWTPDPALLSQWQRLLGDKPFFITEWYAKGADSAPALAKYSRIRPFPSTRAAPVSWCPRKRIGQISTRTSPWPCCAIRPANKGFLTVEYEPYPELCASIKRINTQRYRLVDFFDGR